MLVPLEVELVFMMFSAKEQEGKPILVPPVHILQSLDTDRTILVGSHGDVAVPGLVSATAGAITVSGLAAAWVTCHSTMINVQHTDVCVIQPPPQCSLYHQHFLHGVWILTTTVAVAILQSQDLLRHIPLRPIHIQLERVGVGSAALGVYIAAIQEIWHVLQLSVVSQDRVAMVCM